MPALGPIAKSIEEKVEALGPVLVPYRPIGILLGKTGEIRPGVTEKNGTLYVLRQNGGAEFEKIGTIVASRGPVVDGAAPQGSIVYVRGQ